MIDLEQLQPPSPAIDRETAWVLRAAFAKQELEPDPALDPQAAREIADRLGVAERIGALRAPGELPSELADWFRRAQARAAAVELLYGETAREVAEVAREIESPLAFLKGTALVLARVAPPGGRAFSDIDVLVPAQRAEDLAAALADRDFEAAPVEATEQHLPEMRPPRGGSLEVHFALRGIELRPREPAGFEDLLAEGALRAASGEHYHLPARTLMAAHALVHAFQQHLLRPDSYPLFRMVSDLIDLLPDADRWRRLESRWHPSIEHAVSRNSFDATRELCSSLARGERPPPSSAAGRLLDHLLVGGADPAYSRSLRRAYLRERLSDAHQRGALGDYLSRKLRPIWRRGKTGPEL